MINWNPTVFTRETHKFRAVVSFLHGKHPRWVWSVFERPGRGPQPFGHGEVPCKSGEAETPEEAGRAASKVMGIEEPHEVQIALPDIYGIVPKSGVMRAPSFTTEAAARSAAKSLDKSPKSSDPIPIGIARYQLKEITSV